MVGVIADATGIEGHHGAAFVDAISGKTTIAWECEFRVVNPGGKITIDLENT